MVVVTSDGGEETGGCVSGVEGEEMRVSVGRQVGEGIWAEVEVDWEWAGSSGKGNEHVLVLWQIGLEVYLCLMKPCNAWAIAVMDEAQV